jgi:uncharacterized protein YbjT (DUF2867 family)
VRNVLDAGSAQVETNGELVEVCDPQILTTDEAFARLPAETKRPPRLLRIGEFLALRRTEPSTTTEESDDPGGLGP